MNTFLYLWHHNITYYKATARNKAIAKKQKQKLFYTFVNQKKETYNDVKENKNYTYPRRNHPRSRLQPQHHPYGAYNMGDHHTP